jgi:hypothetical protein
VRPVFGFEEWRKISSAAGRNAKSEGLMLTAQPCVEPFRFTPQSDERARLDVNRDALGAVGEPASLKTLCHSHANGPSAPGGVAEESTHGHDIIDVEGEERDLVPLPEPTLAV